MTLALQQPLWPPENAHWNSRTKAEDVGRQRAFYHTRWERRMRLQLPRLTKRFGHVPISVFLFVCSSSTQAIAQPTSFFIPPCL
ncbi:hypothetical protein BDZ89DRAFT_1076926, partial [Hymenopellis radicata]